jgi:acyl carrier protein
VGIDALDLAFRLEKAFGVTLPRRKLNRLYFSGEQLVQKRLPKVDPTIGEIHSRFCQLLVEEGVNVPADSWDRVRQCVAACLSIDKTDIQQESRFYTDLGAS